MSPHYVGSCTEIWGVVRCASRSTNLLDERENLRRSYLVGRKSEGKTYRPRNFYRRCVEGSTITCSGSNTIPFTIFVAIYSYLLSKAKLVHKLHQPSQTPLTEKTENSTTQQPSTLSQYLLSKSHNPTSIGTCLSRSDFS